MNNESRQHRPHIIKRIKKVNKHHGGSWKIAYADFVTAMMAFFLLMWLLSLLNKYQLEGVARYFRKPLKELFTKQDTIAQTDTNRPDHIGATTEVNTGAKMKTENVARRNAGESETMSAHVSGIDNRRLNSQLSAESKKDPLRNSPRSEANMQQVGHENSGKNPSQESVSVNSATSSVKSTQDDKSTQEMQGSRGKDTEQQTKAQQNEQQTQQQQTQQKVASMEQLKQLRQELQERVNQDPEMQQYKNLLNFVITSDGLKIELRDLKDKPMFSEGKTDFQKYAKSILQWLTNQINMYPNAVVVIGHTDGVPYTNSNNYSNWELSADRANATRRSLINSGMGEEKIIRIMGAADHDLLNKNDKLDPSNRRIEIIILTNEAAKRMQEE